MQLLTKDTNITMDLPDEIFSYPFNEGLIHQAVVTHMNNARSGNSAQKTRAEVRGGGRKPWNQKGTGRARAGSIRSPIWRSGGVTFASKKRDYTQKINKKMYKRAMRSIISELARTGNLIAVDDFQCQSHKTSEFVKKMKELDVSNALVIMHEVGESEYLASRNLPEFDVTDTFSLDPVILLQYKQILLTREAAKKIEEQLQ